MVTHSRSEFSPQDSLMSRLIPAYWQQQAIPLSSYGPCKEWSDDRSSVSRRRCQILPEHVILQETIWMLAGLKHFTVYRIAPGGNLTASGNIGMKDLSADVFENILLTFCSCGNTLQKIRSFLTSTQADYAGTFLNGEPSALSKLLTILGAFVADFDAMLEELLLKLEQSLIKERPYGILLLHQKLSPFSLDLQFLTELFDEVILPNGLNKWSTSFLESVVLNFLHGAFLEIWRNGNRQLGTVIWRLLSLVLEPHGQQRCLTDNEVSPKGVYGDLVKHIREKCSAGCKTAPKQDEGPHTPSRSLCPSQRRLEDLPPFLRIHFSSLA